FLVSKEPYGDFELYVEFWASDDANSGVFLRCSDPESITDRNCYEVNIFDQRPDPSYGTGGIVNFVEVDPMPKAGGKWNTYEITAKGRQISVVLNGETTAELNNGLFAEGPIALQHGDGVVKGRKVAIKPLWRAGRLRSSLRDPARRKPGGKARAPPRPVAQGGAVSFRRTGRRGGDVAAVR